MAGGVRQRAVRSMRRWLRVTVEAGHLGYLRFQGQLKNKKNWKISFFYKERKFPLLFLSKNTSTLGALPVLGLNNAFPSLSYISCFDCSMLKRKKTLNTKLFSVNLTWSYNLIFSCFSRTDFSIRCKKGSSLLMTFWLLTNWGWKEYCGSFLGKKN